ncbi:hypothetical protein QJQ45_022460 [Haematococcus lacustris]|nr:hypothetical protein QJQ45_022460 [Haematococcus lacustris]
MFFMTTLHNSSNGSGNSVDAPTPNLELMAELTLKICVVGPCKSGKTLLCRAVAEQPLIPGEYQPTAAVRVQEFSRTMGVERIKVQLWDCSGSSQYQPYWSVLSKDLDGIILLIDPQKPDQEKELESLYMNFAQPNSLTIKQCLILALQITKEGSYGGLSSWNGLQGKLSKLTNAYVSINPSAPTGGVQEAFLHLDKLFAGCAQHKKDVMESEGCPAGKSWMRSSLHPTQAQKPKGLQGWSLAGDQHQHQ